MDRLSFLRNLLGSAALLTLPPRELLAEHQPGLLDWTEECELLHAWDGYVKGFRFHEGPQVLAQIKDEDDLDLVREYDNEHDPDAVAVYWQGHKLGYLPMMENRTLANLIDHGMKLAAYVIYTQPDEDPWVQCFIGVQLIVPSNPSFQRYIDDYMERPDAGYKQHRHYGGESA